MHDILKYRDASLVCWLDLMSPTDRFHTKHRHWFQRNYNYTHFSTRCHERKPFFGVRLSDPCLCWNFTPLRVFSVKVFISVCAIHYYSQFHSSRAPVIHILHLFNRIRWIPSFVINGFVSKRTQSRLAVRSDHSFDLSRTWLNVSQPVINYTCSF